MPVLRLSKATSLGSIYSSLTASLAKHVSVELTGCGVEALRDLGQKVAALKDEVEGFIAQLFDGRKLERPSNVQWREFRK